MVYTFVGQVAFFDDGDAAKTSSTKCVAVGTSAIGLGQIPARRATIVVRRTSFIFNAAPALFPRVTDRTNAKCVWRITLHARVVVLAANGSEATRPPVATCFSADARAAAKLLRFAVLESPPGLTAIASPAVRALTRAHVQKRRFTTADTVPIHRRPAIVARRIAARGSHVHRLARRLVRNNRAIQSLCCVQHRRCVCCRLRHRGIGTVGGGEALYLVRQTATTNHPY